MTDQQRIEQLEQRIKTLEDKVVTEEQVLEILKLWWQNQLCSATPSHSR